MDRPASGAARAACGGGGRLWPGEFTRELRRRIAHHPHGLRTGRVVHPMGEEFAGAMEGAVWFSSPALFHETGVLWMASDGDAPLVEMTAVLRRCDVPFEILNERAIAQRYPQFSPRNLTGGVLETTSGVLMGRRAVMAALERALSYGAEYQQAQVAPPSITGGAPRLKASQAVTARTFPRDICVCLRRVARKSFS